MTIQTRIAEKSLGKEGSALCKTNEDGALLGSSGLAKQRLMYLLQCVRVLEVAPLALDHMWSSTYSIPYFDRQ